MSFIELPGRFARQVTDPDQEPYERNLEYGEVRWNLSVPETALVLVDCWVGFPTESYRTRSEEICRTKIKRVVEMCREVGVAVVHAPDRATAENYPAFRYRPATPSTKQDERSPTRTASSVDWPDRAKFRVPNKVSDEPRLHEWRDENNPDGYRIDPSIEPAGDDVVVATGDELQLFCREKRIRHLVYVGFATNFCVQNKDYGVRPMSKRGYNIVLIRDATTAVESSETVEGLWATRAAVFSVEINVGVTATAKTFIHACRNVKESPPDEA